MTPTRTYTFLSEISSDKDVFIQRNTENNLEKNVNGKNEMYTYNKNETTYKYFARYKKGEQSIYQMQLKQAESVNKYFNVYVNGWKNRHNVM